jgi:hypothetical protein
VLEELSHAIARIAALEPRTAHLQARRLADDLVEHALGQGRLPVPAIIRALAWAAVASLPLDHRDRRAGSTELIEQRLGRLAGDDPIRYRVGVSLVGVARLANASLELHTTLLLNDVSGLVRRRVEVR